jgi:hypothetical protein
MEEITRKCIDYFGSDTWMGICHPILGYVSPWRWLKDGKDIAKVNEAFATDTFELTHSPCGATIDHGPTSR